VRYRWLVAGDGGTAWVNARGPVDHDVPDADDFVLTVDPGGPDWHLRSAVYQVFPDRFASSGLAAEPPEWAVPRPWDELPTGRGPATPVEWFGGDLRGLEQRLDHVERLGVSALYLTPIFPARSTHRYDATSFDRVDPLLGGDEALASLVAAAHGRGLRLIGDLTTNHCGDGHDWFRAALASPAAPERELFYFDGSLPNGYESWLGVPALPKLDWRSAALRERMLGVARRWLEFGLDGWRIDVANMTGRYGDVDLNGEVARVLRGAVEAARPDGVLVAEHFHDFRGDLAPGGWHGTMNYSGFMKPAWSWLRGDDDASRSLPLPLPRSTGPQAVATMRAFRAGVPWSCVLHSWTLLDSHDVARFRTVSGSRERQLVGVGLQATTPGVPMVFAGDELGLEGEWGEDARRPMPWDRQASWDIPLLEEYRRLLALRRSSEALARGGIRYAFVDDDVIAYLREAPRERLLCLASRAEHGPVRIPLGALGCRALETAYGGEPLLSDGVAVLPAEGPSFHVWRLIDG
jgi:alpha-glucosidase